MESFHDDENDDNENDLESLFDKSLYESEYFDNNETDSEFEPELDPNYDSDELETDYDSEIDSETDSELDPRFEQKNKLQTLVEIKNNKVYDSDDDIVMTFPCETIFDSNKKDNINFKKANEVDDNFLLKVVICIISSFIEKNKKDINYFNNKIKTIFDANVTNITITDYIKHIYKSFECTIESILQAVYIIIDMINTKTCEITQYNIYKVFLITLVDVIKFQDDFYYDMKFYAKNGGVSMLELNKLEVEFLQMVNFDLWIDPQSYFMFLEDIVLCEFHESCDCLQK
jgi:hypothetical protein